MAELGRGRTSSPRSRRRSLDSDVDMSHTWPALMADMGGTMRGTRCVTRGIAVDNEHPLYANRCELAVELVVTSQAINRDRSGSFEISLYGQT
jgi:hypothetical protein